MNELDVIKQIVFNPYLLTFCGLGYVWIIMSHFKIHWKIKAYIEYRNTCKKATSKEILEWSQDAFDPRWSKLNPAWNKAIQREYKKRGFLPPTLSQDGNRE